MRWFSREAQIADLQAEIEAAKRTIKVQQAELDAMAAVIARDRERVRAETAIAARRVAEAEIRPGKETAEIWAEAH